MPASGISPHLRLRCSAIVAVSARDIVRPAMPEFRKELRIPIFAAEVSPQSV